MTQNEKDLLLKDLCSRLPYKVKVYDTKNIFTSYGYIKHINGWLSEVFVSNGLIGRTAQIEEIKPYLFPMSSMTAEQNLEYLRTCRGGNADVPTLASFEWCDKNHFDYRGLIPMGLAEDATCKNIY